MVNDVAGLLMPDAGLIASGDWTLLDTGAGVRLRRHHRRLGHIVKEGWLFPHLNARQNLSYCAWFAPRGAAREDKARVMDLLGIGHLLARSPGAMSGGEKQRVVIGRALLSAPRPIRADAPLVALDEASKAEILPCFERLRDAVSMPIPYVSELGVRGRAARHDRGGAGRGPRGRAGTGGGGSGQPRRAAGRAARRGARGRGGADGSCGATP